MTAPTPTQSGASQVPDVARAGRAIGAMFFAGFGAVWLALWAYTEFRPPWLALTAIAVVTALLLVQAYRTYQFHKRAFEQVAETPESKRQNARFNYINAGQWIAIFVVANILSRTGHGQYILPAIIAIVGLHFLPLASLFAYAPHYLTGAALLVWTLAYTLFAGPASSLGPLGAGIVLWCSAAWAVSRG